MKQPIDLLNPLVAEMLKIMETVFRTYKVDYYLVGAIARDISLSTQEGFGAKRKTNDVDIAILLDNEKEFYAIKEALVATNLFEESSYKAIKLIYKAAIEVDLLPFGEIENEARQLLLSRHSLLVMDMKGFKEVYPFTQTIKVAEGLSLNVCSLEGLVILKLIANNDNPDRTKDITDIEHFIEVYFDLKTDEIYNDFMDVMDLYNTEQNNFLKLVSARIIGRKMKEMLENTDTTLQHLKIILSKRPVDTWIAMMEGISD